MKRPAVLFTIALAYGIYSGFHSAKVTVTLITAVVLALVRLLFPFRTKLSLPLYLSLLFFIIGAVSGMISTAMIETKIAPALDKSFVWQGRIERVSYGKETDSILLKTDGIISEDTLYPLKTKIRIYLSGPLGSEIQGGDTVQVFITPKKPSERRYPGDFGKEYSYARGISAVAYTTPEAVTFKERPPLWDYYRICGNVQRSVADRLRKHLSYERYAMITALLIGERTELSTEAAESIRSSGLSHLIAVSGSHFSILMSLLEVLIIFSVRKQKRLYPITILVVLIFIGVVGFSPAVMRSGIMILMTLAASCLHRRPDSLNDLFTVVGGMLLIRPHLLEDVSFLLSASATLSICLFRPWITERYKNRLIRSLLISVFAFLGVIPVSIFFFREISPISIISTPLAMPLVTVSMILGILVVLGFSFLAAPLSGCLDIFLRLAELMGNDVIPAVSYPIITRTHYAVLMAFFLSLYLLVYSAKPRKAVDDEE